MNKGYFEEQIALSVFLYTVSMQALFFMGKIISGCRVHIKLPPPPPPHPLLDLSGALADVWYLVSLILCP